MGLTIEKKRVLIFVVSYKAQEFIESVLTRIPENIWLNSGFNADVLVIDDQSGDETFQRAYQYAIQTGNPKITVLHNPINQGYGGNQKIGYYYAIQKNYDVVVLLHGDGQYPPENIEQMILPLLNGEADCVLGSRMIHKDAALRGHMPLYKWIGNQILTFLQNKILNSHLAEFHTGFRAYKVEALKSIPFEFNSNYYDFDTDIIIQFLDTQKTIAEIPIPTRYGEEISRVNGFKYGALILKTSVLSRLAQWGLFYNPKFDYISGNDQYLPKFGFNSSHQFALDRVSQNSVVVDLGCGPGMMTRALAEKGAQIISIDKLVTPLVTQFSRQAIEVDLDNYDFKTCPTDVDYVLILDIIEHLHQPELLLKKLREQYCRRGPTIIITTGNIAFLPIRLSLLLGQFNYGKRGILDMDHLHLFTFSSLRNLLANYGFEIVEEKGIPAPIYLALGDTGLARFLISINQLLIRVAKPLFAYQIALVVKPLPLLDMLLEQSFESGQEKAKILIV